MPPLVHFCNQGLVVALTHFFVLRACCLWYNFVSNYENKTARTVLKVRPLDIHVKDLYRVLDWHTFKSLRNYHELLLFWSIKHWKKPRNLSVMFESHQERLDRLETVTWQRSKRGGYERVVTRSITQQNIQRSQENASRNSQRAESFVP